MNRFGPLLLLAMLVTPVHAETIEFEGAPLIRVDISGDTPTRTELDRADALEYRVVITRAGEKFYWRSRNNTPLIKVEGGGAYVTYIATTGAGYVRVVKPEFREAVKLLQDLSKSREYVYSEHILNQLGSITYLGM